MMHHMIFPKRRKIESFHNITQARELKSKSGKKQKNHLIEENVLRAACYLTDARVPGVCVLIYVQAFYTDWLYLKNILVI